jgi:uncharacterized membrane protein
MLNILNRLPWFVMTAFALFLFIITFGYWNFRPDINFLLTKQNLVDHPVWRPAFYVHIFGGMLAIAIGPFQFVRFIRRRFLDLHRKLGKIYVTAILLIAAPTGLYMAFYANGGFYSTLGFICMSILWFYTTWKAIVAIKKKLINEHINWMVRSYAMTFAAVTLRLWVPACSLLFEMEHNFVIVLTAWISWLFNLIAAEIIIKLNLKLLTL